MIGKSIRIGMFAVAATVGCLAGPARPQDKPAGGQQPPTTPPSSQPSGQSTTPPAGQQPTTPPTVTPATTPPAGQTATTPPAAKPGDKGGDKAPFKPEELDQILAPIALYPDDLLSQILMATTYPLEIVEADRWVKKNKSLKGDAAAKALEKEDWDPSVKSLVNLPDVLALLSEKLDWTQKLGDAFIGQQKEVMDTIQKLRAKAKDAGKLETNENQKIEVKQEGTTEVIVIQSAQPNTVYVPVYNPTVVYGTWAYPAYPPYPYYPPAYGVGMGLAVGFAWGYAWGHCNWGGGDVDIDVNRNTNINNNIDRDKYKNRQQGNGGRGDGGRGDGGRGGQGGQNSKFKHDPSHRQGVPYRDSKSASQYGGRSQGQAAQARESYRGRSQSPSAGTSDRSGAGAGRGGASASTRPSAGTSNRSGSSGASATNRGSSSARSSGGLNGVSGGGREAASSSSRGRSSMGSSGSSRSSGSRSGGGGRGGGGRGGGGRR